MENCGYVIPDTPIAVNCWDRKTHPEVRLFFLTHFHTNYMNGLSASWAFPIYASEVTCKFLQQKIGIKETLLHPIELKKVSKISMDYKNKKKQKLSVTAFDANHCPGAVMFLFEGYFGNILYTGSFRYDPNVLNFTFPITLPVIDVLHLDNKYCSMDCDFPQRNDAIHHVLQTAYDCLQKSKRIYIGIDSLGKEDLLVKLAEEAHTKIWMDDSLRENMELLGLSKIVTSEKKGAKILTVSTDQINGFNIERWNKEMPTCAIIPSARFSGFNFQPYSKYDNIYIVPLSNHSSFSELRDFVKFVYPRNILPIIDKHIKGLFNIDISSRADMEIFKYFLHSSQRPDIVVPKSVQMAMKVWEKNSKTPTPNKRRVESLRSEHRAKVKKGATVDLSSDNEDDSDQSQLTNADDPTAKLTNADDPTAKLTDADDPTAKLTGAYNPTAKLTEADGPTTKLTVADDPTAKDAQSSFHHQHNFRWKVINVLPSGQKEITYFDPE